MKRAALATERDMIALAAARLALRRAERALDGPWSRAASLELDRALLRVESLRRGGA